MQYVTTRNDREFAAPRIAMEEDRCRDGGFFLPAKAPVFSQTELDSLKDRSFGHCAAMVLNRLLDTDLSSWDVDFSAGRNPVRIRPLDSRIMIGEIWHNPGWQFSALEDKLLRCMDLIPERAGSWARIAVKIAVLFGLHGQMCKQGITRWDVSAASGDVSVVLAAWFARGWGLPLGDIVCCCNDNHWLWELLCHGQLRTDAVAVTTAFPEGDLVLPVQLERLIFSCGGYTAVESYLNACRSGCVYKPEESVLSALREGLHVSVVSGTRMLRTVPGLYRTYGYLASPGTALAYAGMLDHRAQSGSTRPAVVLSEISPLVQPEPVAEALGCSPDQLKGYM